MFFPRGLLPPSPPPPSCPTTEHGHMCDARRPHPRRRLAACRPRLHRVLGWGCSLRDRSCPPCRPRPLRSVPRPALSRGVDPSAPWQALREVSKVLLSPQPPSPAVVPPVPSWGRHPPSLPESPHLTPPGRLQGLLPPLPTQFRVRAPELMLRFPCQIALAGFCRQLQDAPVSVHFACQGRTQVSPPASPAASPAGPGLCPGLPCVHSLAPPPSSLPSHGKETPAQRGR